MEKEQMRAIVVEHELQQALLENYKTFQLGRLY